MKKLVLLFAVIFVACDSKTERINHIEDIEFAEEITIDFYTKQSQKKYNEIIKIADDSLKVIGLEKIFRDKDSLFGDPLKYEITEVKKTVRENSDGLSYSEYIAAITVKYQKAETDEIVSFVKHNNENLKLKVYTVEQK